VRSVSDYQLLTLLRAQKMLVREVKLLRAQLETITSERDKLKNHFTIMRDSLIGVDETLHHSAGAAGHSGGNRGYSVPSNVEERVPEPKAVPKQTAVSTQRRTQSAPAPAQAQSKPQVQPQVQPQVPARIEQPALNPFEDDTTPTSNPFDD
jgi:hypothetical protein